MGGADTVIGLLLSTARGREALAFTGLQIPAQHGFSPGS
jgi:hypothetical protein